MNFSSKLLENAVAEFAKLPGVGQKTALRLVLHLLNQDKSEVEKFSATISKLRNEIQFCRVCHNISDLQVCEICASPKRDQTLVCVVEDTRDVMAIQNTNQYNGLYHVLGGLISPMDGIGPSDLEVDTLVTRIREMEVKEVIFALSATMEGDTTIFYLHKRLKDFDISISTIARGIAFGGELEYVDEITLGRSIATRVPYEKLFIAVSMKLSVVIVNNNAGERLRVALISLVRAGRNIDHEIIIVDNMPAERPAEMLASEFPQVKIIASNKNEGLAKACNQGVRAASGEYILVTNPYILSKTITLEKITGFMDDHADAGGLSVRMVDPHGNYLPESKHSLSKPWCNFFKYTGLAKYFPKSCALINRKGDWIEEFETTEVDVLNGACMLIRRSVLKETGLFDERFFMYGHDVDLSYRIRLEGYKNYYYAHTFIIQFKAQSADKFSWSYIRHFYGAMFIFAAKYLFKLPVLTLNDMGGLYPASYEVER